jgi:hypothetical protein
MKKWLKTCPTNKDLFKPDRRAGVTLWQKSASHSVGKA